MSAAGSASVAAAGAEAGNEPLRFVIKLVTFLPLSAFANNSGQYFSMLLPEASTNLLILSAYVNLTVISIASS